jgi:hypothetical protein
MSVTPMFVKMSFELSEAEQDAIARDAGTRQPLTPGIAAAWIAMVVERALREALSEAPRETETGAPGATTPGGATSAEVPRA